MDFPFFKRELGISFSVSVKNPSKKYPKAIMLSAICVARIYILGTISLTFILSPSKIDAASSIFSVLSTVSTELGMNWLDEVILTLICLVTITAPLVVLIATSKLFIEGNGEKYLPDFLRRENRNEAPAKLFFIQRIFIQF